MPRSAGEKGVQTQIKIPKRRQENTCLYDFQFTRMGEVRKENRQPNYDYWFVGGEEIRGEKIAVIDAARS